MTHDEFQLNKAESNPIISDTVTLKNLPVPEWIRIIPLSFLTRDGRGAFSITEPDLVIARSFETKDKLPIDFDHQILKDGPAPAAGWIVEMQTRDDGIYGKVDWTDLGAQALSDGTYRHLSPTYYNNKSNHEVLKIHSASLVNNPAIHELQVNSSNDIINPLSNESEINMTKKDTQTPAEKAQAVQSDNHNLELQLCQALGLNQSLATSDIISAIKELKANADKAGELEVQLQAANSQQGNGSVDLEKYVPIEAVNDLSQQLATMKNDMALQQASSKVDQAIESGVLQPVMKDWALQLCQQNPQAFDDFIEKQPVQVVGNTVVISSGDDKSEAVLTDSELSMCSQTGLTPEEFVAAREQINQ